MAEGGATVSSVVDKKTNVEPSLTPEPKERQTENMDVIDQLLERTRR